MASKFISPPQGRSASSRWRWGLSLLVVSMGCSGGASPFDYIPVTGRITFEDGTPIPAKALRLAFLVQDVPPKDGAYPRAGEAVVNADGSFDCVTSYKYGDGLIPGKHKVFLNYATDSKGKLVVPKEYADAAATPLVITTDTLPLEIKVPRP